LEIICSAYHSDRLSVPPLLTLVTKKIVARGDLRKIRDQVVAKQMTKWRDSGHELLEREHVAGVSAD